MSTDRSTLRLVVGGLVASAALIAGSYAVPTQAAPGAPADRVVERDR